MRSDVHHPTISVGDRVRVLTGAHEGEEGRVTVRRPLVAFDSYYGVVFDVEFSFPSRTGYSVQYQPLHLERLS